MKETSWRIFRPSPASIICAAGPGPAARRAGGRTTAAGRIRAVADALTVASAQLAVAREYGFASLDKAQVRGHRPHREPGPSGGSILRGQHP